MIKHSKTYLIDLSDLLKEINQNFKFKNKETGLLLTTMKNGMKHIRTLKIVLLSFELTKVKFCAISQKMECPFIFEKILSPRTFTFTFYLC